MSYSKRKIFNDPVYGLISFNHDVLYSIIDHPYMQRLRRISQQALSHYVYPGALHTRFHHALGALHLMTEALETLTGKGVQISEQEKRAVCIAILLHDAGHGPFSHALEHVLLNIRHEELSVSIMDRIENELGEDFTLARKIFQNDYDRPFLNQLVSGQLDMDRLDYLTRDSYFSGVAEGVIGYDRIIRMLHVVDDQLAVEEKGIYSVEKFLVARRIMYWQVYLHKTVIAAEQMLISIMKRASWLVAQQKHVECSPALRMLLYQHEYQNSGDLLSAFLTLDDTDILHMIKCGLYAEDFIFRTLCTNLLHRRLFKVKLQNSPPDQSWKNDIRIHILEKLPIDESELHYFLTEKTETNALYNSKEGEIIIRSKDGTPRPFSHYYPDFYIKNDEEKFVFIYYNA